MLIQLVYASRATPQFNVADIPIILKSANANNRDLDITGILFFGRGYFLQCLEGPRSAVNRLYNKILLDPRHTDPEILAFTGVSARDFGTWSMGYVADTDQTGILLKHRFGQSQFDPYILADDSVLGFLKALARLAQNLQPLLDDPPPSA